MERLVRLIRVLSDAEGPVSTEQLLRVARYEGTLDSQKRQLTREIGHLNLQGWDIRSVAPPGQPGRYQLFARDNRLHVQFSVQQRAELLRAAYAAQRPELARHLDVPDPAPDRTVSVAFSGSSPHLDVVLRAVRRHCLIRFSYKGRRRTVHPYDVHHGPSGWYLTGREDGQQVVKEFVIARLAEPLLDPPGSAEVTQRPDRPGLDPLSWLVDPPVEVLLETDVVHEPHVEHLLGEPASREVHGDGVRLRYAVTHRAAFHGRIFELGPRVRVVAPDEVKAEIITDLAMAAE
jgi:predicted DNA-binding transcriptional regulator YafY